MGADLHQQIDRLPRSYRLAVLQDLQVLLHLDPPTGPTGSKDPYTPEVVNDPDRYIYNGQEYKFENGKLVKVKK